MHSIDSLMELAGLLISASGCACLIILYAQWLNGQWRAYMMKRYLVLLRCKYELFREDTI